MFEVRGISDYQLLVLISGFLLKNLIERRYRRMHWLYHDDGHNIWIDEVNPFSLRRNFVGIMDANQSQLGHIEPDFLPAAC